MEKWGHLDSYQQYIRRTPSLFPFSNLFKKNRLTHYTKQEIEKFTNLGNIYI
jgi:hypothetical protein